MDFQFNPASSGSPPATAVVDDFTTDATPMPGMTLPNLGDAWGTLPGVLSFDNGTPTNEVTGAFTFGGTIAFDVTIAANAAGFPGLESSTFLFTLFDENGNGYSSGPGGALATIDLNGDGSTTPTTYSPLVTPGPTATITQQSAVPEPSSLVLAFLGAVIMALMASKLGRAWMA